MLTGNCARTSTKFRSRQTVLFVCATGLTACGAADDGDLGGVSGSSPATGGVPGAIGVPGAGGSVGGSSTSSGGTVATGGAAPAGGTGSMVPPFGGAAGAAQ